MNRLGQVAITLMGGSIMVGGCGVLNASSQSGNSHVSASKEAKTSTLVPGSSRTSSSTDHQSESRITKRVSAGSLIQQWMQSGMQGAAINFPAGDGQT